MADRKGGFPPHPHWFLAALVAVTAVVTAPGVALADTVSLGNASTGAAPCWSGGGADAIPTSTGSQSYSLPGNGTITSWSVQAPPSTFSYGEITVGFELWRPTQLADGTVQYALVAFDAAPAPIPADGQVHTYTAATDGQLNDVIGLWQSGGSACGTYTGAADAYQTFDDPIPTFGTTIQQTPGSPMNGWALDLAATFEATPTSVPQPVPSSKADCLNNQWGALVDNAGAKFKNQGDCVSFVENGHPAAG
jgi:hypothetical protein